MISEQNWPKHKTIWCKKVQFKIGLNAKCAIVQNWPEHGKPVQIDNQYKFGTNANSAGTKRSVQNVSVQIGQNKVSTSRVGWGVWGCAGLGGEKISLAALLSGYLGKSGHLPR